MGLFERVLSGSVFKRGFAEIDNDPPTGYTTDLGSTYILLAVSSSAPCRVRLYATSASVGIDSARPSSSFDYSASVALNLDAGLTPGTSSISFNPPIIATTRQNVQTYYNIESSVPTRVVFTYYPIEYPTADGTDPRSILNIPNFPGVSLAGFQTSSGNITTPKSFLMYMAASTGNANIRLRLYSKPIENISVTEKNRPFTTIPNSNVHLISDMLFDSASYVYDVSPVLQAYNLENYMSASNRVGYIIENTSAVAKTNVYTSIGIYSIED